MGSISESQVINLLNVKRNTIVDSAAIKDIQEHQLVRSLIELVGQYLKLLVNVELKLITIQKISNDRHKIVYDDGIKSVLRQRDFLIECKSYESLAE